MKWMLFSKDKDVFIKTYILIILMIKRNLRNCFKNRLSITEKAMIV